MGSLPFINAEFMKRVQLFQYGDLQGRVGWLVEVSAGHRLT